MKTRMLMGHIMREKVFEIIRLSELGYKISEISRSCSVHRATVKSYISKARAGSIKSSEIKELSEDRFKELFHSGEIGRKNICVEVDWKVVGEELRRRGVTLQLLWEEHLREYPQGYGYSRFCQKYNEFKKSCNLSMRQVHKAGEKVFVDYSGMRFPIYDNNSPNDVLFEAEIFVGVLGASNYTFAEAVRDQKLQSWIGSHVRMFNFFNGVPEIVVPDNLKSGVTKADYYEPGINKSYQELAEHYNIAVIPTRVRKPKDKSKVEGGVLIVQRRLLAPLRDRKFYSLGELNLELKRLLEDLNSKVMKSYGKSRRELFLALDAPVLNPLPVQEFVFARWKKAKVNIDYHIEVYGHYYSVPYEYVRQFVDVKISEKSVEIINQNQRIAIHKKSNERGRHSTIKEHMPAQHRYMQDWTPTRFLEWASKIGPETKIQINSILLARKHPEQSYRSCLGILSLAKKHSDSKLEKACATANRFGVVSVKTIKNLINNPNQNSTNTKLRPVVHSNIRGDTEFH